MNLIFKLSEATILLPNDKIYKKFIKMYEEEYVTSVLNDYKVSLI